MNKFFKAVLALCAMFVPGIAVAQMTADPVTWTASASRAGKAYEIRINASFKPGWHIYAMEPGGDGTLIPTSFEFKPGAGVGKPGAVKALAKPKGMTFVGVDGEAFVYEGKTDFISTVTGKPGQTLSLTIGYQSCNEQMCLPPKKKVLSIKLP